MFSRFRISLGFALLAALILVTAVSAKGGFSFITITGADLKETLRTSEPALTEDFFAFADFYQEKTEAPANPGEGYEITRFYMDAGREIAFDKMQYYPSTGYVYYDGLINGSSEYDGGWYNARPEMKSMFENILSGVPIVKPEPVKGPDPAQPVVSLEEDSPKSSMDLSRFVMPAAVTAGIVLILVLLLSQRKVSVQ